MDTSFIFDHDKIIREDVDQIKEWPFVKTLTPIIWNVLYLLFVIKLGRVVMNKKQAYTLKHILLVYNAFQVLFSSFLLYMGLAVYITKFTYDLTDIKQLNDHKMALSTYVWYLVVAKLTDLLDTVFFVLRKKYNQISFLHVYHHSIMVFMAWICLNFCPANEAITVLAILNSFVHVVMYYYYFVAALGPKFQKYLWWKKYMTMMQLIQFCLMIIYLAYTALFTELDPFMSWIFAASIFSFLVLFTNFYFKSYTKQNKLMTDDKTK